MSKVYLGLCCAVLVLTAWLGRYELIGVAAGGEGTHGIAYRLDRWTGEVTFVQGARGGGVKIISGSDAAK
jgi:hypothetical protein